MSLTIIFICTTLFLSVSLIEILTIAEKRAVLTYLGLSYYGLVIQHWYWQIITSPLVHSNLVHLLFNMLTLWFLGPSVEERLGKRGYIVLSLISALCAMGAVLITSWETRNITIGYSGIIYGILVAQALFFPDNRIVILALFPMKMKHAVLLFAAIELYLSLSPEGSIVSHVSHLFGAVGAFVYLKMWQSISERVHFALLKNKSLEVRGAIRKAQIKRKVPWKL